MARPPVLICIHGLGNKPPRAVLADWWLRSIREGFALFGVPEPRFGFEMVYWADFVHEVPLDPAAPAGARLAIEHPYVPFGEPPEMRSPGRLRRTVHSKIGSIIDRIAFTEKGVVYMDRVSDMVVRALFRELQVYTYGTCTDRKGRVRPAREVIREELASALARHTRERTVLLAHSMGTIVAYDVLSDPRYGVGVDTLITVGSPLGLPPIVRRLQPDSTQAAAGQGRRCRAPDFVRESWLNFADLKDQVAFDHELASDYGPNAKGVGPRDQVLWNTYRGANGKRDPHNIFGYTRTPELASALAAALAAEAAARPGWLRRFAGALARFFGR